MRILQYFRQLLTRKSKNATIVATLRAKQAGFRFYYSIFVQRLQPSFLAFRGIILIGA